MEIERERGVAHAFSARADRRQPHVPPAWVGGDLVEEEVESRLLGARRRQHPVGGKRAHLDLAHGGRDVVVDDPVAKEVGEHHRDRCGLVAQGPLRILFPRWRYNGGRWL